MKILASWSPGEIRAAAWGAHGLVDYALWRPGAPDGVGDTHRGRIAARVPAMAGAFVALENCEGFLPDSESRAPEGTFLAVRITRAAQGGKGPRLAAADLPAGAGPPALLRRGPNPVERLLATHPGAPVEVDDAGLAAMLRAVGARVRGTFTDAVEGEITVLESMSCGLPGGARMTISPTPALVAIDVDLGGGTAARGEKGRLQMAANRGLLPELARQIRLRNLSGAIVVDLGGMALRARAQLAEGFAQALAGDPLKPRFLGFSALGLAEILRPRVHPPLHELLRGPHAEGLRALRSVAPERLVRLRAMPAIVAALHADGVALRALAERCGWALAVIVDPGLAAPGWVLEDVSG